MLNMFNGFYDNIWIDSFKKSYDLTLWNLEKIQLYISSPVFYYWTFLTWLYSAQVVPNDEIVSQKYGKKIFAFPEFVLKSKREEPFMRLQREVIEKRILHKYRKFLFWEDKNFYKVYDIETIWHEIWHMLWWDIDTELTMNKKTWVYKNIEEFKATTWWLVSYFLSWKDTLRDNLIIDHIIRCIWLLKYRNEVDVIPYYSESLLHLDILFKSRVIYIKKDKIYMYLNDTNYKNLKENYIEVYTKLIYIYLNKLDAWEFLFNYLDKHNDWYYIPKNQELANFVEYYYELYKQIWNEVDKEIEKEKYIWKQVKFLERILS
jgi:hypothetical protein